MSQLDDFLSLGLTDMKSKAGETFTLRGASVTGIINDISEQGEWEPGGERPVRTLSIVFTYSAYSPVLRTGETVTARGKALRIEKIENDTTAYTLTCVDVTAT